MNLDTISDKHVNELERLTRELLNAMRRAKFHDESLVTALQQLEIEASRIRRERFDEANSEFNGY